MRAGPEIFAISPLCLGFAKCIILRISDEEAAWVARLRYVLSHGVKGNLVLRSRQWPGLQCIDALTEGKPLEGFWHDRTLECEANRRGKGVEPETFIERYTLEPDPLPCWRHLPQWREEGRQEGEAMAKQEDILLVARHRFSALPSGFEDDIREIQDLDRLNDLLQQTLQVESLDKVDLK